MAAIALVFFALLSASLVHGEQCTTKYYGDVSGVPVPMQDTILPPPQPDWDINIPNDCQGLQVTVCDPDSPPAPPPDVYIDSLIKARVHRYPPILLPAVVHITKYCHY